MNRKRIHLTPAELKTIEEAVSRVEQKTTGEIVPFFAHSSSGYRWVTLFWILAGWCVASLWLLLSAFLRWEEGFLWAFRCQMIGMFSGFLISRIPALRRGTIPSRWRKQHVHDHCLATFLKLGVHETRERNGILIFFSLFEREIEILADKGVYAKVDPKLWEKQVEELVRGIHTGTPVPSLVHVINGLGGHLTQWYPSHAKNTDELSNRLQTDDEREPSG